MASRAATSSTRATTVATVASAIGMPARAPRNGRSTSPAFTGSVWLANSAAWRIANRRPIATPLPERPSSARQANARRAKAAA